MRQLRPAAPAPVSKAHCVVLAGDAEVRAGAQLRLSARSRRQRCRRRGSARTIKLLRREIRCSSIRFSAIAQCGVVRSGWLSPARLTSRVAVRVAAPAPLNSRTIAWSSPSPTPSTKAVLPSSCRSVHPFRSQESLSQIAALSRFSEMLPRIKGKGPERITVPAPSTCDLPDDRLARHDGLKRSVEAGLGHVDVSLLAQDHLRNELSCHGTGRIAEDVTGGDN